MSDSINSTKIKRFSALSHFKNATKGTTVRCINELISYPPGWAGLVEEMVIHLKPYSIAIFRIDYSLGDLDVEYICPNNDSLELQVLKICDRYRGLSKFVCKTCGNTIYHPTAGICDECQVGRVRVAKTGTWLDKY